MPLSEIHLPGAQGRLDRKIKQRLQGQNFMFKALRLRGFPDYFQQRAISPRPVFVEAGDRTMARELKGAQDQLHVAGYFCLAVIDAEEGQQERGDYSIPWERIRSLITTKSGRDAICEEYEKYVELNLNTTPLPWADIAQKIKIIPSKYADIALKRRVLESVSTSRR